MVPRFTRCLDLYLCPRSLKMRMNVDPASLLPQLPNPKDLRPFPTQVRQSAQLKQPSVLRGHWYSCRAKVRELVDPGHSWHT